MGECHQRNKVQLNSSASSSNHVRRHGLGQIRAELQLNARRGTPGLYLGYAAHEGVPASVDGIPLWLIQPRV